MQPIEAKEDLLLEERRRRMSDNPGRPPASPAGTSPPMGAGRTSPPMGALHIPSAEAKYSSSDVSENNFASDGSATLHPQPKPLQERDIISSRDRAAHIEELPCLHKVNSQLINLQPEEVSNTPPRDYYTATHSSKRNPDSSQKEDTLDCSYQSDFLGFPTQQTGGINSSFQDYKFNPLTEAWAAVSIVNYTVMYSVVCLSMLLLFYTVYLLLGHLSYMSQALHLLIVGFVAMAASVTLTINRYRIENFEIFYSDPWSLCEYANNGYFEGLMKNTTRKKNKLIITWIVIYGTCGLIGVNQPVIDHFFGSTTDLSNVNGAWLNLPIVLWWPVDVTTSDGAWLAAFLLQGLYLGYCIVMVTSGVILFFSTADRLLDQIKLIVYSINTLDKRAKDMFRQRFPGLDRKLMEKEYDDCYYDCLVQNVKHHIKMVMWVEQFMDMASIPVAVPFFAGAILLGMALITITEEDDPRLGPKCLAASLAFSEAYNMYLLCNLGQQFQQLSQDVHDALYFCQWSRRSERVKRAIRIMRIGCAQPIKLTAAKLIVLNMELFADLVNSAYSIFNLKAASKDKDKNS